MAGSNPIKFIKQARASASSSRSSAARRRPTTPSWRPIGDEVEGLINTNPYSLDLDTEANKRFIAAMRKYHGADVRIGHYAACFYVDGQVIEAALAKTGGKSDDPRCSPRRCASVTLADTPRGPISFDDHGNVVIDVYVRRAEKQGGKMVNKTIKTYHEVSQFWTWTPRNSCRSRCIRATTRR